MRKISPKSIHPWCHRTPLCHISSYSTWIFCRGDKGFATDCPCDVWCRGLTTCLLHVGPPFGNRFLNTIWDVGLTYWIVYLHFFFFFFFVFWHMQLFIACWCPFAHAVLRGAVLKGLRMVARALWRSEARRVVPWYTDPAWLSLTNERKFVD